MQRQERGACEKVEVSNTFLEGGRVGVKTELRLPCVKEYLLKSAELLEEFTASSFRDPRKAAEMFAEGGAFEMLEERHQDRELALNLAKKHPELFEVSGEYGFSDFQKTIQRVSSARKAGIVLLKGLE